DDEDATGELADRREPLRPPRPDLRADVVHDRNAQPPDAAREPEIEIGKVDDDERVGPVVASGGDGRAERRERSRQLGHRFRQTGDGEPAIVFEQPAARRLELRPAETKQHDLRIDRAQLARERTGIQITGRLPARQQNARGQDAGRLKSDGSTTGLILISLTRRSTLRVPTLRTARNAPCTPSTAR